jgi:serine protease
MSFFIISNLAQSQSNSYYYKGAKKQLTLDRKQVNIFVNSNFNPAVLQTIQATQTQTTQLSCEPDESEDRMIQIKFTNTALTNSEFIQRINVLKNNVGVNNVAYFYKKSETAAIGTSKILYVKLKNAAGISALNARAIEKNFLVDHQNQFMPLWYQLKLKNKVLDDAVQLSNYLFETGLFEAVDPAFMFDFKPAAASTSLPCANDEYFAEQWGLHNTANPTIDVNACEAWTITEGAGINVAVLDTGIEKTHSDLSASIGNDSFDTCFLPGSSPSVLRSYHGTWVSGVVSATKNNNNYITGIAPQSKLIDISNGFANNPQIAEQLANGINWAWQIGNAHIINNSWGDKGGLYYNNLHSQILENAIQNAMNLGRNGLGTIVIFSSGNFTNIDYPAYVFQEILNVGANDQYGVRSIYESSYNSSAYGAQLDVVAPGTDIYTTANGDDIVQINGTSFSAPMVAGIAALILSVNPCLSNKQVRDIIEKTCQKVGNYNYTNTSGRPNGTWNNEMGYGLVDAHAAVLLAQAMYSATLDLMVKDTPTDFGIQPNTTSTILWNSPDIWVRNQQDAVQENQNPQFNPTIPNYIYVRVTNKSCATSTGSEKLKIYCSIPNYGTTSSSFRSAIAPINSSVTLIGTLDIPALGAGQETIVSMPWNVPFFLSCDQTVWNTFLLTKIVSPTDLNAFAEGANTYNNIKNNNNIAGKSIMVINTQPETDGILSGSVGIENATAAIKKIKFEIIKEATETGKAIYEEAEISIKMDETLYTAWQRGGKISNNITATTNEKVSLVTNNLVELNNTVLHQNEIGALELKFNFLTQELTDKTNYLYHVIQKNATTNEIEGGCTFEIHKNNRPIFLADAGNDKAVDKNEPVTISAAQISEPAV